MNNNSINQKVLKVILTVALSSLIVVSLVSLVSVFVIRGMSVSESSALGSLAAESSKDTLAVRAQEKMQTLASDTAKVVDEKFAFIENQTRMAALNATRIASNPQDYALREIGYLTEEQIGQPIPYIRTAPGVDIENCLDELYLMSNISDTLELFLLRESGLTASYLGHVSGFFISVDKNSAAVNSRDYEFTLRPWYTKAQEQNQLIWTDIFLDSEGRGMSIACAAPFYDTSGGGEKFMGVVSSGAVLGDINNLISETKTEESGYAFLLNEKGQVIITPKTDVFEADSSGVLIGEDYLNSGDADKQRLAETMLSGQEGILQLTLDGAEVYISFSSLSVLPWTLGVVVPVQEVVAPAEQMHTEILDMTEQTAAKLTSAIFTSALILVLIVLVVVLITNRIAKNFSNTITAPIVKLTEEAKLIGSGSLDHKVEIKTGDEVQTLAETFNIMVEDIKTITGEKERIGAELGVATKIQASMLPCIFPPYPQRSEFDIYASMLPAKEVGGDFYDFFLVDDDTLAVVMADVSGKGVPAALFMVIAKTLIKNTAQSGKSPAEVFCIVNNMLCENNEEGMFVTAFMGFLSASTGEFTYVNAGHNPPLKGSLKGFEWLPAKPGLVLAMMDDIPYVQNSVFLQKDEILYLYTDGVTEAMDPDNELYSDPRLLETINAFDGSGLSELLEHIKRDIDDFASGAQQADDITMLALKYLGSDDA